MRLHTLKAYSFPRPENSTTPNSSNDGLAEAPNGASGALGEGS